MRNSFENAKSQIILTTPSVPVSTQLSKDCDCIGKGKENWPENKKNWFRQYSQHDMNEILVENQQQFNNYSKIGGLFI